MVTRRQVLTLTGSLSLAGCLTGDGRTEPVETDVPETDTPTPEPTPADTPTDTETPEETTPELSEREQAIRQGIPLDGLGAYEDQMLEAGPVQETTAKEINEILEGSNTPQQEADKLSQKLTDENFGMWMAEYHRQKDDPANSVVVNENYGFFQDSGPILEIYTVQAGELQSRPTLSHTSYNKTSTHKPGDGPNPRYLRDMRDSTDWAQMLPQDFDAFSDRIESLSEEEKRVGREIIAKYWSAGLFGISQDENIIPHDRESSNVVFDGLYHDGDPETVVDLNNQYRDSELFNSDVVVSAEYTGGGGWKFHRQENYEMGDELPGHQ